MNQRCKEIVADCLRDKDHILGLRRAVYALAGVLDGMSAELRREADVAEYRKGLDDLYAKLEKMFEKSPITEEKR